MRPTSGSGPFRSISLALVLCAAPSSRAAEILFPLPGLTLARQHSAQNSCGANLARISFAAREWSLENPGRQPQSFLDLTNRLPDPSYLFCPANSRDTRTRYWEYFSWENISYTWLGTNSASEILSVCSIHDSAALADGTVVEGPEKVGWPVFLAEPVSRRVTPGSTVRLDFTVAPDALTPLQFQWRREELAYRTNRVFVETSPEELGEWRDVTESYFRVSILPDQTNAFLQLQNVQTNDSGFYSVSVSNELGRALSSPASLVVTNDTLTSERWTDALCLNNLRQIALLANLWATDHSDRRPAAYTEMTNRYGLPSFFWPSILFCPSDLSRTPPTSWTAFDFGNTSYDLLSTDPENLFAVSFRCKIHGYYAEANGRALSRPRFDATIVSNRSVEVTPNIFGGRTNILESSSNLTTWTPVSTYSHTNGPVPFTTPATEPHLFYRLRLAPDQ